MKTYDLRNVGTGCVDNPALALLDVFAKGEEEFQIIVKKVDISLDILKSVAESCGYKIKNWKEKGGDLVAVLRRI